MNSSNNRSKIGFTGGGECCKDCREKFKNVWDGTPLFVQFIVLSTVILYLLNLFIPFIAFVLADIPYYTVFYFQIWRLFTTVFMTTGIFSIIFGFIFWVREASSLERSMGTFKYMVVFFMNSILIQVIYNIMMIVFALVFMNSRKMMTKYTLGGIRNEGLWPVIMSEITLLCMSNPNAGMHFFFFPCEIKAKYYPFVLFGIFTLLSNFHIDFEVLSGIIYGILYHYYLKNRLQISDSFIQRLENHSCFRWLTMKNSFIFLNNIGSSYSISIPREGREFTAFKGKGISIGGGSSSNKGGYSNINVSPTENNDNDSVGIESNDSNDQGS